MATIAADASIEDIMEDLQLHHVILQSLNEQRPDAVEERQEILDTIKGLETRLAELRGDRPRASQSGRPPSHSSTPDSNTSRAQVDGAFDHSMPSSPLPLPRWGSAAMSPPRRQSQPHQQTEPGRSLGSLSIRKRHRDGYSDDIDLSDDLERSSKRIVSHRRSPSANSSAASIRSSQGDGLGNSLNESNDELRRIFGLDDNETLRALQQEQRKAEEWLEERKEQERRDAEYARMLTDGLYDQPRPGSAQSSSSTHYSGSSLPFAAMPSSAPAANRREATPYHRVYMHPQSVQSQQSTAGIHSFPNMGRSGAQLPPITIRDSDDSDVAEITPNDFQRHMHRSTNTGRNYSWINDNPSHQGSARNPYTLYSSPGALPGPSGSHRLGPMYGPNVLQNTMARLNAGRELVQHAGRQVMGDFADYFTSSGASSLAAKYPEYYDKSLSYLNDFYDQGVDPKKAHEEIKQLLETIRPDSDIPKENREGTPDALKFTLMNHQRLGLSWMKSMEESEQKGGILADDMGLGKTIQAIALIVSRPSTDPERKTTLIIAPVSLMQQWKREIERCLRPRHQLTVYILHGDKRGASFRDLKRYDVVLTTFGTLSSELKRREKYDEYLSKGANEETLARTLLKALPCLGPNSKWYRIIIDEAQCIKNRNTRSAIACCRLHSTYRWCMSGTPMMNSVEELHSLLKFLRIRPYSSVERFNTTFTRPLKNGGPSADKAMTQLQVLLKAVLLRRTKTSKIDGEPILELPPRVLEKVHAVFSEDEQALYDSLESRTQLQFNKYLRAGTVGRNYSSILVLLLRLRQACCHPHLMRDFSVKMGENTDNANTEEQDFIANAKAFGNEVVIRLKENENLECPICIDAVENPIIFFPCGHGACAECFSRMTDPSLAVQQGQDGTVEVKCPNCRARVDPKKITDHVSFKKVHFPDPSDEQAQEAPLQSQGENENEKEDEDEDESDDDSDDDSLSRFIADDDEDGEGSSKRKKGKGKKTRKSKSLAELKKESSKNIKSKLKYLRRLEKNWVTSAKIEKTLEILQQTQDREEGEKTIVFSQFTSLLDLLEVPIVRRGWGYRRYDGSMKPSDRNSAVLEFTDNPDCKVMLVSLKAGNSGLNLVAASQVIIFDPFWNPYVEEQAIDRAHRIGQMREVHIHRILVEKTVEDRILELQDKKRELIEGALDENASKNVSRLGTRELAYLFGVPAE